MKLTARDCTQGTASIIPISTHPVWGVSPRSGHLPLTGRRKKTFFKSAYKRRSPIRRDPTSDTHLNVLQPRTSPLITP